MSCNLVVNSARHRRHVSPAASERSVVHRKFKYSIFAALAMAMAMAFMGGSARAAMIATPFLSSPLVGIFTLKLPNIIRPDNISCFCFNLLHLNFKGDEHLTACTTNICTVLMKLRRGTANSVPRWADEAMQKSFYQSPAEQMCSPVDHKYSHARQSSITTMNR